MTAVGHFDSLVVASGPASLPLSAVNRCVPAW